MKTKDYLTPEVSTVYLVPQEVLCSSIEGQNESYNEEFETFKW